MTDQPHLQPDVLGAGRAPTHRMAWVLGSVAAGLAVVLLGWVALPRWEVYHRRPAPGGEIVRRGTVEALLPPGEVHQPLRVRLDNGPQAGQSITAVQRYVSTIPPAAHAKPGDRYFVATQPDSRLPTTRGPDAGPSIVTQPIRDHQLLVLVGVLVALLGIVCRRAGAATVLAAVLSSALLVLWLLPQAGAGANPLHIVAPLVLAVCVPTLLLVAGPTRKAAAAIVGSLVGVGVAAAMALWMADPLALTGLDVEFATIYHLDNHFWYSPAVRRVNFRALQVAGIIFSALGAAMDVAMDIASSTTELRRANPAVGRLRVALAGMNVGRATVGMMLLVFGFIYIGTNIPFMLAAGVQRDLAGWIHLLSFEGVAVEAVRLVAAGVGLALTIPATAVAAALLTRPEPSAAPTPVTPAIRFRPRRVLLILVAIAAMVAAGWLSDRVARRATYHLAPGPQTDRGQEVTEDVVGEVVGLAPPAPDLLSGEPTAAREINPVRGSARTRTQPLAVLVRQGCHAGRVYATDVTVSFNPASNVPLAVGDAVHLQIASVDSEPELLKLERLPLRYRQAILFGGILLAVVMLVGGTTGLRTAVGLALATGLTLFVYLPLLADKHDPLWVTLGFAVGVSAMVFLVLGRFSRAGLAAMLGMLGGLVAAGLIALVAAGQLHFTGIDSAAARALWGWTRSETVGINFRGLLSAAMLVALFGVALDIAIAVAVGMRQVREAGPALSRQRLFRAGMTIGRDLTATMILTLLFAFLGLHLPVLLVPQVMGWSPAEVVNREAGSAQIVTVIVGAIGLVLTAPLTALAGAMLMGRSTRRRAPAEQGRDAPVWALGLAIGALVAAVIGALWIEPYDADGPYVDRDYAAVRDRALTETDPERLAQQADSLIKRQDYHLALAALWRVRDIVEPAGEPLPDFLLLALGSVYAQLDMESHAVPMLEELVRRDPEHAVARLHLGRNYIDVGCLDAAVEQFEWLARPDPQDVDRLCEWANALRLAGRSGEARVVWERARRLNPEHDWVLELQQELAPAQSQPGG